MLPEFELLMPRTLPEALEMLAQRAPDVMPIAGGTNVIPDLRGGRYRPACLVNVAGLPELQGVRREDGVLVIGAGVTIAEVLEDPLVAQVAPVLREAARMLASPLVRNRATVAGNLANASPAADMAPPLLVLDAEVELASVEATRRVPLKDFFVHVRRTVRQPHELITAIRVPLPPETSRARFFKVALRKADAIAVVNGAVWVEMEDGVGSREYGVRSREYGVGSKEYGEGRCRAARIALGAVAPTPIRAYEAERALEGRTLTPEVIAEAARLAAEATRTIDDIRGSAAYRRVVTEVMVQRMLAEVGRME
ncbi:MAG: xanthine dehydrogenase family protein subunit M [Thermoflexales bacterium]|nr:xanthine dehydrogenase family protein subunit M [Thermoflexales bacterium]